MLIDLEGLEGTDIVRGGTKDVLQRNIMSALMTVASVSCILVKNDAGSLIFVGETINKIVDLQKKFGFCVERIHLLFHDKDTASKANGEFVQLVNELNERYFAGNEVIVMRNKPNFKAENVNSERKRFLKTLLDDSLYAKKSMRNDNEELQDLLTLINVITSHPSTDLSGVQLTLEEVRVRDEFVKPKLQIIADIQKKQTRKMTGTYWPILLRKLKVSSLNKQKLS